MNRVTLALLLATSGCSLYFGGPAEPAGSPGDPAAPADPGSPAPGDPHPTPTPTPPPARCEGPEVNVIGVYQTHRGPGSAHPVGDGHVIVERPGLHTLVLSAYEPTRWHITTAPGAHIKAVYLFGYHAQTTDLPGVPVVTLTYEQGGVGTCGYSWPYNGQGCDTNQLLARAEAAAGRITTFNGCYDAARWDLHLDGKASSDCDVAAGYQPYGFMVPCRPAGAAPDPGDPGDPGDPSDQP